MSSTRDPLRDLVALQERMNHLFDQVMSKRGAPEEDLQRGAWTPSVDIEETNDKVILRADMPGILLEQIELKVHQNHLTLRGERLFDSKTRKEDFHRIERPSGKFYRSFELPQTIDQEKIQAKLKNGVLEVTLPKRVESNTKPMRVEIR